MYEQEESCSVGGFANSTESSLQRSLAAFTQTIQHFNLHVNVFQIGHYCSTSIKTF